LEEVQAEAHRLREERDAAARRDESLREQLDSLTAAVAQAQARADELRREHEALQGRPAADSEAAPEEGQPPGPLVAPPRELPFSVRLNQSASWGPLLFISAVMGTAFEGLEQQRTPIVWVVGIGLYWFVALVVVGWQRRALLSQGVHAVARVTNDTEERDRLGHLARRITAFFEYRGIRHRIVVDGANYPERSQVGTCIELLHDPQRPELYLIFPWEFAGSPPGGRTSKAAAAARDLLAQPDMLLPQPIKLRLLILILLPLFFLAQTFKA
jgi:hypothetical protein